MQTPARPARLLANQQPSSYPKVGQTSAHFAVGGLVGGDHVGGDTAAFADLVAVVPGPLPDRLGVLSGLLRLPRRAPAAGPATVTHPPGMLQVGGEELLQLSRMLLAQLDLVVAAVVAEPHRRRRRRTIEVIDQLTGNLLGHLSRSFPAHRPNREAGSRYPR